MNDFILAAKTDKLFMGTISFLVQKGSLRRPRRRGYPVIAAAPRECFAKDGGVSEFRDKLFAAMIS